MSTKSSRFDTANDPDVRDIYWLCSVAAADWGASDADRDEMVAHYIESGHTPCQVRTELLPQVSRKVASTMNSMPSLGSEPCTAPTSIVAYMLGLGRETVADQQAPAVDPFASAIVEPDSVVAARNA